MSQSLSHSQIISPRGETVSIVQLTDTHLCKMQGGTLLGMDTDHSLQAVIDLVKAERPTIDLLLGTGDLSDQGALEAYRRLQEYFAQLTEVNCWLPGNHDDRANMTAVVDDPLRLCREIRLGRWQVLMLDSQVPGEVGGELGAQELAQLEQALVAAATDELYSLVCLHHQPIKIGCEWLDEQMVADAPAFFSVLDRFSGVRGVLWGHVHQQVDSLHGDIQLMATPSTCVQFAPGSVGFKADSAAPGYRWLELLPDGTLHTGVSRVEDVSFKVDLDSGGYL